MDGNRGGEGGEETNERDSRNGHACHHCADALLPSDRITAKLRTQTQEIDTEPPHPTQEAKKN